MYPEKMICWLMANLVALSSALAQHTGERRVIPPSPTAAALGKYGSVPVAMYTGVPEIDIPLYTIKSKSLELPISLSYHAAGFRVSDSAPWTGLGWSLLAGGSVSRSAVGMGDDAGSSGFLFQNGVQSKDEIDGTDLDYLLQVSNGTADNESDYYFYNFAGRCGKFVFDQDKVPFLIPREPIRIIYRNNTFEITTEDGTLYKFAKREMMKAGIGDQNQTHTSTYHLSQIVSADETDVINFYYGGGATYKENTTDYLEIVGDQCEYANGQTFISTQQHSYGYTVSFRDITEVYLDSITFSNGNVVFTRASDRTDFGPGARLTGITINKKKPTGGGYIKNKSFSIQTGYYNGGGKRLKLTGITELDATGVIVKKHSFYYNEAATLPGRGSPAQDWWGFPNGKNTSGGHSLIQQEVLEHGGYVYTVGNADRSPDAARMQACILQKIKYPTGGYTEFDYEPHYFDGATAIDTMISASSGAIGNTTDLLQQTVQFTPSTSGWARVHTHCSNVTSAYPFFSRVALRAVGGSLLVNHIYDPYAYPAFAPQLEKDYSVYLSAGTTYELTVQSKGASASSQYFGAAFSQAQVYWKEFRQGTPQMAGGLRVKEIRDYEVEGAIPVRKIYKYGQHENGKGILMTPANKLGSFKEPKGVRFWSPSASFCRVTCSTSRLYIHGDTPQDLTTLNGSPVVYPEVTVYENSVAAPNGKSIYRFNVEGNEIHPAASGYRDGVILLDNGWKGGDMVWSASYTSTNKKIKENSNVYTVFQYSDVTSTRIGKTFVETGICNPLYSAKDVYTAFYSFDFPIRTGIKKLTAEQQVLYAQDDPLAFSVSQTDYEYDNLNSNHQQLSRKITLDSEGNLFETKYWYPADYFGIENIPSLLAKNIINVPVKTERYRNGMLIEGKVDRPDPYGKPYESYKYESTISPTHQNNQIVPAGYVKKATISYDVTTRNIRQVQPTDHAATAYLWDYNNTLPVAKVVNASTTEVAATSFESDGKGNWSYTGSAYNDIPVKTGSYYYKLSGGSISRSLPPGKYKLEYWAKAPVTLAPGGNITTIRTSSPDTSGWILYEKEINTTTVITLTLSGAGFIDELRVYPATAQMTTYTYDRLNGITSLTDPGSVTVYYEYDAAGRLRWIRDHQKNIVKALEYHYKGN
jgi:YD repeat-containing protein